jgi:hypothetical protein
MFCVFSAIPLQEKYKNFISGCFEAMKLFKAKAICVLPAPEDSSIKTNGIGEVLKDFKVSQICLTIGSSFNNKPISTYELYAASLFSS